MLDDLKWGIGGGIGMILLSHFAVTTGLISSSRGAPLLAGGALLMLITIIVLLFRSGTGIASGAATISCEPPLLPSVGPFEHTVHEPNEPADQLASAEKPSHDNFAEQAQNASVALPPAKDQATEGVHPRLRQAVFSFKIGSCSAEFLLRVPRNATTSEIAEKAVAVAQQMMWQQGVPEDEWRHLEAISGHWALPET
jgi:hypothetical protein